MNSDHLLTAERLRADFHYEPETGVFVRTRRGGKKKVGTLHSHGYLRIGIGQADYYAHRLAWLYMTGEFPEGVVDHWDRNKQNNAWSNLFDVTQSENGQNSCLRSDNTSGHRGVFFDSARRQWSADIWARGQRFRLGRFDSKDEAIARRVSAEAKLHVYLHGILP